MSLDNESMPTIVGDNTGIEIPTSFMSEVSSGPQTQQVPDSGQLNVMTYFPSAVYSIIRQDFLDTSRKVCAEFLKSAQKERPKLDTLYPLYQTNNLFTDARMQPLVEYIGATIWNVLESQGYAMANNDIIFHEMWCQEHHKHSGMDEHVHNRGAQMIGFYFLDVPDNSSKIVIHDPRPGKKQINLPETDMSKVSYGSDAINFTPEPGMLFLANAWLPHSFGRHGGSKPIRFIHFTAGVNPKPVASAPVMPSTEVLPTIV
jgi:hypothetical protein